MKKDLSYAHLKPFSKGRNDATREFVKADPEAAFQSVLDRVWVALNDLQITRSTAREVTSGACVDSLNTATKRLIEAKHWLEIAVEQEQERKPEGE